MRQSAWFLHEYEFASARETDEFYWSIVREIREAQERGELARRWAPFSFVPPEWGQLVRAVPGSLPACWRAMTRIGFVRGERNDVEQDSRERFDAVALRRGALVRREPAYGVHLHREQVVARFDAVKRWLAGLVPAMTVVFLVVAVAGAVAAQFVRRRLPPVWYVLTTMLWGAFILRLGLAALLDATGVVAVPRYMFASAVMVVVLGVLGLCAVMTLIRSRSQKRAGQAVRNDPIPH
jgi:hypothetical protein